MTIGQSQNTAIAWGGQALFGGSGCNLHSLIMWWAITTILPLCGPPAAVGDTDLRPSCPRFKISDLCLNRGHVAACRAWVSGCDSPLPSPYAYTRTERAPATRSRRGIPSPQPPGHTTNEHKNIGGVGLFTIIFFKYIMLKSAVTWNLEHPYSI